MVTVAAKILVHRIWKSGIGWEEEILLRRGYWQNPRTAVVYSRIIESNGKATISLICAKTRVKPSKPYRSWN